MQWSSQNLLALLPALMKKSVFKCGCHRPTRPCGRSANTPFSYLRNRCPFLAGPKPWEPAALFNPPSPDKPLVTSHRGSPRLTPAESVTETCFSGRHGHLCCAREQEFLSPSWVLLAGPRIRCTGVRFTGGNQMS